MALFTLCPMIPNKESKSLSPSVKKFMTLSCRQTWGTNTVTIYAKHLSKPSATLILGYSFVQIPMSRIYLDSPVPV